jgi:hypothetical protein
MITKNLALLENLTPVFGPIIPATSSELNDALDGGTNSDIGRRMPCVYLKTQASTVSREVVHFRRNLSLNRLSSGTSVPSEIISRSHSLSDCIAGAKVYTKLTSV